MNRLKILIFTTFFILDACTSVPDDTSTLRMNYVLQKNSTQLIRGFDNQKDTLLQFSDLTSENPKIYEKGETGLKYSVIGPYAVVPGIHDQLYIKTKTGSVFVVRLK